MSVKRYEFDLSLLQKDLVIYGHDPHTHYYLGITHHAWAEGVIQKLQEQQSMQIPPEVTYNLNEAIKYLSLRALAT